MERLRAGNLPHGGCPSLALRALKERTPDETGGRLWLKADG